MADPVQRQRDEPATGSAGWARRLGIFAAGFGLIVGAIVFFAGPPVLSRLATDLASERFGAEIEGRLELSGVRLSWTGGQRVESIRLLAPDGAEVASLSAEVESSLLRLLAGGLDLGRVGVTGEVTVVVDESGRASLGSALAPSAPAPAPPIRPGPAPEVAERAPFALPESLAFDLDASGLAVRVVGPDGFEVGLRNGTVTGAFAHASPVALRLRAEDLAGAPAVAVTVTADRLTDARGAVDPDNVAAELWLDVALADTERLASWLAGAPAPADPAPRDERSSLEASLATIDGALTLADQSRPATLRTAAPGSLIEAALGGGERARVDVAPWVAATVREVSVPLAALADPAGADWRGARFAAELASGETRGAVIEAPGAPGTPFVVAPVRGVISAAGPRLDVRAVLEVFATYDGVETDALGVEFEARGLLDDEGRPADLPDWLSADLVSGGLPTALLAGAAAAWDVDPNRLLGDTVALRARLGISGRGDNAGAPLLSLTAQSANLSAWASLGIGVDRVTTLGEGVRIQSDDATYVASLLAPWLETRLDGRGTAYVQITDLEAPLRGGVIDASNTRGVFRVVAGDVRYGFGADHPPVVIESLDASVTLAPGEAPGVGLDARAAYRGLPFTLIGRGRAPGVGFGAPGGPGPAVDLAGAAFDGRIDLEGAPVDLLALVSPEAADAALSGVGPSLGGQIDARASAPGETTLSLDLRADRAAVLGEASISARGVVVRGPGLTVELFEAGEAIDTVIARSGAAPNLRLGPSGDVELVVTDAELGFGPGGAATASGTLRWRDVEILSPEPARLDLVDGALTLGADGALEAGFEASGAVGETPVTAEGEFTVADALSAERSISDAELRAEALPTSLLSVLPGPGPTIVRSLGATADARVGPIGGGARGWRFELIGDVPDASVRGEVRTGESASGRLTWRTPASAFTEMLESRGVEGLTVREPVEIALEVGELTRGPAGTPLRDPDFRLDATFTVSEARLLDREDGPFEFGPMRGAVASAGPGRLRFELVTERTDGDGVRVEGVIDGLADASGALTPGSATIDGTIVGEAPTTLIDSLAGFGGLGVALVGPSVATEFEATGVTLDGASGRGVASLRAPYASADLAGDVRDDLLALDEGATITVGRLTPEGAERLFGPLFPMLTRFEKTEEDEPAVFEAEGLELPLGGGAAGLNGRLRIDPGTMTFETDPVFGRLLAATGNNETGSLGRRIDAFDLAFRDGVVSWDEAVIHVGEYELITLGSVDLVAGEIDLYVMTPFYAVNKDVAKIITETPLLGPLIGRVTLVPIRVYGPFDGPTAEPDIERMLTTLPQNIGRGAEGALDQTIGEILRTVFGGPADKRERLEEERARER